MDKMFEKRFRTLFEMYGIDSNDAVLRAKAKILQFEAELRGVLRADAALFLLVNVDHMIIRSRALPLPFADEAAEPVQSLGEVGDGIDRLLDDIFETLKQRAEETEDYVASAHEIMRLLDGIWEKIIGHIPWV